MISAALVEWAKLTLENKKAKINQENIQLSQLTIVVPSFCRQEYLLRQVVYWSFSKTTVIIVDGSIVPLDSHLVGLISDVPNISYISLIDTYINRLKEVCKNIKTPYAMCLADDDICSMAGLSLAIDHLNKSDDIVACMGQVVGVDYDQKKMRSYFFPYGDSLEDYHVKHNDPIRRIHLGIDNYRTATSYAVFRTSIFVNVWGGLQRTSCLEATEYEHAIATYTLGSLETIPNVYWLRSFECDPVHNLIDGTRKTNFDTWWTSKEYEQERVDFVSRLAIKLSKNSSLNLENSSKEIIKVIDYILEGRHTGLMNKNRSIYLSEFLLKTIKYFPFIYRCFVVFGSTKIGGVIRRLVIAGIREATVKPVEVTKYRMADQSPLEPRDVLEFISAFHAAQGD
jgi:glycosyltransferase domain-containing protein